MLGRYQRASSFLEGTRVPNGIISPGSNRVEEMTELWRAVVNHCRYAKDLSGLSGEKDSWQKPSETFSFRNGDCEDTSLLLADWLNSRGFRARVAVGDALRQGGHAWVVVEIGDRQYVLETTLAEVKGTPPESVTLASHYKPKYLFDRQNLYFRVNDQGVTSEYFSSSVWQALAYPSEATSPPNPLASKLST